MKRTGLGVGRKSLERGSTFAAVPKPLERTGGLERKARIGRGRRRRRGSVEREQARVWHRIIRVLLRGACVVRGCRRQAGEWGHHLIEKEWLRRMGLAAHVWDLENGVPICTVCHDRHTSRHRPVTRDDLIAAGVWQRAVAWARRLDAMYFAGREPVLAKLEQIYPDRSEVAA